MQNAPKTKHGEVLKFVNWYLLFLQPSSQTVNFQMRFHNPSIRKTKVSQPRQLSQSIY